MFASIDVTEKLLTNRVVVAAWGLGMGAWGLALAILGAVG
jgi:hypothetical protein